MPPKPKPPLREGEFYAKDRAAWRRWLEKNHDKRDSVWLIIYRKSSTIPSIYYPEAVEEALCFGWIDSKPNKRDSESRFQYFARRKPNSKWSQLNKQRVEKLIRSGLMAAPGLEKIALAKKSGTWHALETIEALTLPPDLEQALSGNKKAFKNFTAFPPSSRKIILYWIQEAKQPETRKKRIAETVKQAAKNLRANHYRQPKKMR